ncbi:hypothetical protein [Gibbsiella quercinecans]|uniref:hypothetical protein n=1 Tax=Gibbsiella quercinecans TaxID=929813 RepID=UPI00242EF3DF|nr:hypothetical protein [Gibbsiella quercinecans]
MGERKTEGKWARQAPETEPTTALFPIALREICKKRPAKSLQICSKRTDEIAEKQAAKSNVYRYSGQNGEFQYQ